MSNIKSEVILSKYNESDRVVSWEEAKKIKEKETRSKEHYFFSGFEKLDELTGGFSGGQLVVVSAPTNEGKTTFCFTLTRNFARHDRSSLWLPYEGSMPEFFVRYPKFPHAYIPLELAENKLDWIENRVIEAKLKFDISVVFIDNLHYLLELSSRINVSLLIGEIMRNLKRIAIKHDIAVFLIAHIQKLRIDSQPELESLRDSSFVAQEADKVLMMWRVYEEVGQGRNIERIYDNRSKLVVLKDRQTGARGYVNLRLDNNFFEEVIYG